MKTRSTVLPVAISLLLSTAALAQQPVLVKTDNVKRMEFSDQIRLVGRTEAWVESKLVAEIAGRVESIDANEGVYVKKGASLVSIDADKIRLDLDSKKAEAEQARLRADLAQSQLKRAKELFAKTLISQSGMDSANAWAGISQAQYDQLKAEQDNLALDLQHCTITAPQSGYTGRRLIEVGEWVNPGTPVYEFIDLSRIRVRVDLPERNFGHVKVGSPVAIELSGDKTPEMKGKVTGIAPAASAETHTFPVIVEVPNPDGRLGGGMLVQATLSLNDKFESLAVSKDAVVRNGGGTQVFTVVDGKASPISITTTSTQGDMVAVKSDALSEGMPVVVRGNERIFPGAPVQMIGATDAAKGQSAQ